MYSNGFIDSSDVLWYKLVCLTLKHYKLLDYRNQIIAILQKMIFKLTFKNKRINVTLDHKTIHTCLFFIIIEIYTSSESWIYNLSIDVWFVMIGQYLKIWNLRVQKNLNIEKIIFKVVQMKFLAMHITNQKLRFDIFTVGNLQNILMKHYLNLISNDFWHKIIFYNFDPYNVSLSIATNIPVLLMTAFMLQGHK